MSWLRDIWARSGKQIRRLAGFLAAALVIGFSVQWLATSNARMIVSQPVTINDIALSPDGELLAVAYADGTVELRETDHQRNLIRRISNPSAAVMRLHLDDATEAGLRLIMARADGRIVIETARDGAPLSDDLTIERSLLTPHFVVARDGALWVQGINERGAWLSRLEPDDNYAQPISMAVSAPLQVRLLSASSDRAHVLTADQHLIWGTWDPETDYGLEFPITIKHRLPLREGYVTLQDGRVMTAENGTWRSATGDFIETERGFAGMYGAGLQGSQTASGEMFNPNAMTAAHRTLPFGSQILVTNATTGASAVLRVNDRGPFEEGRILDVSSAAATELGFTSSRRAYVQVKYLGTRVTAIGGESLETVQLETAALALVMQHPNSVIGATYSNDGALIATTSAEGNVGVWSTSSGTVVNRLEGENGAFGGVDFSSDDRLLAAGTEDGSIYLWDMPNGNLISVLEGHEAAVHSVQFSPDDAFLLTASGDGSVRLWDTVSQTEIRAFEGHIGQVNTATFSSDGDWIVTSSNDQTVRIWPNQLGAEGRVLEGHERVVHSAEFSPDGSRIVSAGIDGTIRIWATETGEELAQYMPHTDREGRGGFGVMRAVYSQSGTRILTAGADGTARLLDAESGFELAVLNQHNGPLTAALFSPDGNRILTTGTDENVIIWTEARPNFWVPDQGDLPCQSADGQAALEAASPRNQQMLWMWSTANRICKLSFSATYRDWYSPAPDDTTVVKFLTDSTDGTLRSMLIGRADGTVEHRGADAETLMATYHGHGGAITHIETVTVDDKIRVAIAASDGSVQIIDLPDGGASLFARANTGVSSFLSDLNDMRVSAIDTIIPGIEETESDTTITAEPDAPLASEFYYYAPGDLIPDTGTGYTEDTVFAPDITFPIKDAPASVQSIVFRPGGGVVGGDQCDPSNYHPAWRDNYCERRSTSRSGSFCASDRTSQRVTIRVGTAEDCRTLRSQDPAERGLHEVVAVADGIITYIGSYSVRLTDAFGTDYIYYHLNMNRLQVNLNDAIEAGHVIGYVSNDFGGTPTNFHLGFEIIQQVDDRGSVRVPPYMSLVRAYERREGVTGQLVSDDEPVIVDPAPTIAVPKALEVTSDPQDPVFYIHFDFGAQSTEAQRLVGLIKSLGYDAPLIQDPDALPSVSQLRYFKREDQDLADEVARRISGRTNGDVVLRTVYFEDYEDSTDIRDQHFEIWLADPENSSDIIDRLGSSRQPQE